MKATSVSRREFVAATSVASVGTVLSQSLPLASAFQGKSKLAIRGGTPVRTKKAPRWPMWDPAQDEELLLSVIRSGVWSRAKVVTEFEQKSAALVGATQRGQPEQTERHRHEADEAADERVAEEALS